MLYLILALIIAGAITALLTWVFSRGKEESPIIHLPQEIVAVVMVTMSGVRWNV